MNRSPLIIGHRGASTQVPENTLAAFRLALDVGADGLEFDVQLSKDGVPVVIHDPDLRRTGLRPERVGDLTADQLGKIDVGSWFNAKFARLAQPHFASETVPTLEQVLDLQKQTDSLIYIELKCDEITNKPLVSAVCELIRDSPMLPRMIIKSFTLVAIPEIRKLLPKVQTAALFEPSIKTILRRRRNIVTTAREFGAHQISIHYSLATAKLTSLSAEAQMPVTIWTADDVKWLALSRQRSIGSLITNDPQKLILERDR